MMHWNCKWPVVLFFYFNIISDSFPLSLVHHYPPLSNSFPQFPFDPSWLGLSEAAAMNHAVAFPLTWPGLTHCGQQ